MVYADLHVHTDRSDGQLSLSAVPGAARRAGVAVVAVTDHDRLHPDFEAPVVAVGPDGGQIPLDTGGGRSDAADTGDATTAAAGPGDPPSDATEPGDPDPQLGGSAPGEAVTVIRGIELRVETGDGRVDLLGYAARATDELVGVVDRIQENRKERGRAIVECVEDRLGIDLDVRPRRGLGRPHVARAVADHPGADLDYDDVFAELIGDGEPCYVAREVPAFEEGRRILAEACGLVALAHPLRYPDPAAALGLAGELDAVELHYPYGREVDLAPVRRAIEAGGLLATGGSDAHDDRLGRAGLDREEFERVWAAL